MRLELDYVHFHEMFIGVFVRFVALPWLPRTLTGPLERPTAFNVSAHILKCVSDRYSCDWTEKKKSKTHRYLTKWKYYIKFPAIHGHLSPIRKV